jgi:hypothetical protein
MITKLLTNETDCDKIKIQSIKINKGENMIVKNKQTNKSDKAWYVKLNNALFNSIFTALVSLTALAAFAVYGIIALLGDSKLCIAIAVCLVILLTSKVLNKLSK